MKKKQALLIGSYTKVKYHPLKGVDEELQAVLGDDLELTCTEQMEKLKGGQLAPYALCISYTDCWDYPPSKEEIAGLLNYVISGGGLLVIHTGISLQYHFEFIQMIGGKFTGHPEMEVCHFDIELPEHPVVKGLSGFDVYEEPYQFTLDPFSKRELFLTYTLKGVKVPAAWSVEYGLGRIIYLMIGHTRDSFKEDTYREVILRSSRWCCKEL